MSALYGPQHEYVAALVERARSLTEYEARDLFAAWNATPAVAWVAARDATESAARSSSRAAEWDAAWVAARDATRSSSRGAASLIAAWDAAIALSVRDLIPAEHYDVLTLPWRTVVGRIHPDDPEVTR